MPSAPRPFRQWSDIRSDIYEILRETDQADSYWTPALVLILWNQALDKYNMVLADQQEGWVTSSFTTDLVANQSAYALPAGAGRVRRVVRVRTTGGQVYEHTLSREEHWGGSRVVSAPSTFTPDSYRPTYRLLGNELRLSHSPNFSETDGLRIDLTFSPARFTLDTDTLDPQYPDVMETMLIWDTAYSALSLEGAQGNVSEGYINSIKVQRDEFFIRFMEYTATRSFGRSFSTPQNLEG